MAGSNGNRRRQSLREVFLSIVRRAGEWPADALLIAGDLFEWDRLSRDTVGFLHAAFESVPHVPVFIAPGNHDPFVPNSPYATESWPHNVHIFASPDWASRTVKDGGLTVHGFGFDGPDVSVNPFGRLHVAQDGAVHVAVGHGSERSHQPPDKEAYAPFNAAEAALDGLAYLALGHFHAVTPVVGKFTTKMYYCGAPEGHGFRETGVRHYLEVEIDGDEVRVTPQPSSRVVYAVHEVDCAGFGTTQDVIESIRAAAQRDSLPQVARVVLKGACSPSVQEALSNVYDVVGGDFEHLELLDRTHPWEDYDALARENTSIGAFVCRATQEHADAPDEARRQLVERAREVGVAAFRGYDLGVRGLERV